MYNKRKAIILLISTFWIITSIKIFSTLEKTMRLFIRDENIVELDNKEKFENKAGAEAQAQPPMKIDGINVDNGIEYCGGIYEIYIEVLDAYYQNSPAQLATMKSSVDSGDIDRLTIEAHSLKSASHGIGADELGELAYSIEKAGKSGDTSYVESHVHELLDDYRAIIGNIGKALHKDSIKEENSERKRLTPDVLIDRLGSIIKSAENYKLDNANAILDEIMGYSLNESEYKKLMPIKTSIMQFSYSSTIDAANKLLAELSAD